MSTQLDVAAELGADIAVLGEKWACIGEAATIRAGAEDPDGPSVELVRAAARDHGMGIVAGSLALRGPDGVIRNTSLAIDRDGAIAGSYSKLHMFDVAVGGITYCESEVTAPGDGMTVAEIAGVRVGLSICYDLRFPELYRSLAAAGAQLVTAPAAFTVPTGRDHWETLVRARAIENQMFVAACGLHGPHEGGKHSYGHSMIVDPWGAVLAQVAGGDSVALAECDLGRIEEVRGMMPVHRHRRGDVYGELIAAVRRTPSSTNGDAAAT